MENSYRVLIVDDNREIHQDFKKILESQGGEKTERINQLKAELFGETSETIHFTYTLDSAYQGAAAIELAKNSVDEKKPYSIAFVDVLMPPGIDGIQTTLGLWEVDP